MIALLNKPRVIPNGNDMYTNGRITSLILVPHRDLAYQLYHWIEKIVAASSLQPRPPISSMAQVLVRNGDSHLTQGLRHIRQTPPHILIGTPQAVLDIYKKDPQALQFPRLSSVVVDEVDYLIETIPKKDPKKSFHKSTVKANRKLLAHPGVTRELLDIIFAKRKGLNEQRKDESGTAQHQRRVEMLDNPRFVSGSPQLILSSATLRSHLSNYLFDESGWLNKDYLLKVKGTKKQLVGVKENGSAEQYPPDGLGGYGISHSVLLVSEDGIQNITGAALASDVSESENLRPIDAEALFSPSVVSEPVENDPKLVASKSCIVRALASCSLSVGRICR